MMEEKARNKKTYFRETTAQQRQKMFERYEETGNASAAAREAHVGRSTFYYWKGRYEEGGYEALEERRSRAPHNPRRIKEGIVEEVKEVKGEHPEMGRNAIANEIAKRHGWHRVVSPSTVRRILIREGIIVEKGSSNEEGEEKGEEGERVRHAQEPGETINVDLCFVPSVYEGEEEIPAVSGSSGRLVVSKGGGSDREKSWPGQVFGKESLSYEEAMDEYIEERKARLEEKGIEKKVLTEEEVQRKGLLEEEEALRISRRKQRQLRKAEDEAWEEQRKDHKEEVAKEKKLSRKEKKAKRAQRRAAHSAWKAQRQKRKEQLQRRKEEDEAWRKQRKRLRQELQKLPLPTVWIAILVIVDNCTRQCLGLPLFVAGAHVTAEMVTEALSYLLPPELKYLISDGGVHFTSQQMKALEEGRGFVRVPLPRHRPKTNGIAERFIRTLKEWLETKVWNSAEQLKSFLLEFLREYNDRPHQGWELMGLSPNEYAARMWCV